MTRAYVGIGSNIEPERHVRAAVAALRERYGPLLISPVYASAAFGFEGDEFYNLVVALETEQGLPELANTLARIEREQGRPDGSQRFAPRTLDLDILTFGDTVADAPRRIPRDEITYYAFVLRPLADIAPDERHPALGARYAELWQAFDGVGLPLRRVDLELV